MRATIPPPQPASILATGIKAKPAARVAIRASAEASLRVMRGSAASGRSSRCWQPVSPAHRLQPQRQRDPTDDAPLHPSTPAALLHSPSLHPSFPYFLGRMLWGSGALGEQRAPPHAPLRVSSQPAGLDAVGLHALALFCSQNPVHHWAGCGLSICYGVIRWRQVAQADDIDARVVLPALITVRSSVTNCYDANPNSTTLHG